MRYAQAKTRDRKADLIPLQTEFPLRVPVCAWCRPATRGEELISHGICPRHFRKMKQEIARQAMNLPPTPRTRSRSRAGHKEPLLPLH